MVDPLDEVSVNPLLTRMSHTINAPLVFYKDMQLHEESYHVDEVKAT